VTTAAEQLAARNADLTPRLHMAVSIGSLEWASATVEEKAHIASVLAELLREAQARAALDSGTDVGIDTAEVIGRLRVAVDFCEEPAVNVAAIVAIVRSAIVALGGTT
jgi:hypothetical protein